MATREEIKTFYYTHYDALGFWLSQPGYKVILGDETNRVCRFCGKKSPEVEFRKTAHAIPEALGNKSIESAYECDSCNEIFGQGIENDFGNWSKPMRTFCQIRGKKGVPIIKKTGHGPGWRVGGGNSGLKIQAYSEDPFGEVDEANKTITFKVKRDPYTPVAVLKTFMKMGLTLLPESEIRNFLPLLAWVQETDHLQQFAVKCKIMYSRLSWPMPNDKVAAIILRRQPHVLGYPYAYLVLSYGNEVFQVPLPSMVHDAAINGKSFSLDPFPVPMSPDPIRYEPPDCILLDLTGREQVRDDIVPIVFSYEDLIKTKIFKTEK